MWTIQNITPKIGITSDCVQNKYYNIGSKYYSNWKDYSSKYYSRKNYLSESIYITIVGFKILKNILRWKIILLQSPGVQNITKYFSSKLQLGISGSKYYKI